MRQSVDHGWDLKVDISALHVSSQNGSRVKCLVPFNMSTRIETRQGIPKKLDAFLEHCKQKCGKG